jgi:pimeloyl-ACP methyl ester carboxylesterase
VPLTSSETGAPQTGATDSPQRIDPYTYDTAADLGVALLKHLGLSQAVYIGHSAGGTCTLFSYLKYPEVFHGIILIDAAIYTCTPQRMRVAIDTEGL